MLDESEEPLIRSDKHLAAEDKHNTGRVGTAAQDVRQSGSFAEIVQGLGVQSFTPGQLASITAGTGVKQRAGFDLFEGTFRGTPITAWRLTISQPVSSVEVYRAYSRFCASHPNVCAVMGICIEPLDAADPMEEDSCCPSPSGQASAQQQQQTWQQQAHQLPDLLEQGCHVWVLEERHGQRTLAARLERGLLSWQHALGIAQDIGAALAYLQSLRRICPLAAECGSDAAAIIGENSNALAAPLSPLAVAQMLVLDNVQLSSAATAKLSLAPALLTQLEFALCVTPDAQRVAEVTALLLPYIHPASMFGGGSSQQGCQAFDGLYSYGVVLLQLLTERSAPGLLGTVTSAIQQQSLGNLVPRTPAAGSESEQLAAEFAALALSCCGQPGPQPPQQQPQQSQQQQQLSLDMQVLPTLQQLTRKLESLGTSSMSWEQVEELLMLPLQPSSSSGDPATRRWVRQDFKMRRKLFLEEVAKLAAEGPIHKIEVRRSRCFKDSVTTFSGKVSSPTGCKHGGYSTACMQGARYYTVWIQHAACILLRMQARIQLPQVTLDICLPEADISTRLVHCCACSIGAKCVASAPQGHLHWGGWHGQWWRDTGVVQQHMRSPAPRQPRPVLGRWSQPQPAVCQPVVQHPQPPQALPLCGHAHGQGPAGDCSARQGAGASGAEPQLL